MATSILTWRIPWTEEPGGLQSVVLQRSGTRLLYPLICQWTLRMLPYLGYCKQCYCEHTGACIFSNYSFLHIYAQEWNCWIIWQLYFQFFKEPPYCFSLVAQSVKSLQCGRAGFDAWVGKIPWRRKWQPTPVFLPGKSRGWRSLAGYSPWGHKESEITEQLHFHYSVFGYLFDMNQSIFLNVQQTHKKML